MFTTGLAPILSTFGSSLGAPDTAAISIGMAALCPDSARQAFVCSNRRDRSLLRKRAKSVLFDLEPRENARSILSLDLAGAAREEPKSCAELLPLLDSSLTLLNYVVHEAIGERIEVDPGLQTELRFFVLVTGLHPLRVAVSDEPARNGLFSVSK